MAEDLFGDIPAAPTTDADDDLFGDIPEPPPTVPAAPSPARRWMADYGLRLYKAGYRPIPIKPGDKAPDMDGWQHLKRSSLSAFRVIPRDFPNAGIGILSFNTPGVDIDVKDPGLAAELDRLAAEMLGWAPVRVGMPPKRLRAYRCATPFRKIKPWQGWVMPGEEGAAALKGYKAHNVEILAEDNQFVAMGVHPDTHRPYLWEGRGLLDVAWDGLTPVTEESLLRFMEAAEGVFLRWGCKRIEEVRGGGLGGGCGVRGARQTSERGNLGASLDKARGALDGLPNADLHYDTWIKIGLILKGAFGDEGWPLFDDWSAKSVKYSYEVTERAWDSLSPRGEVTIGTLYSMAKEATGWSVAGPAPEAEDDFEVIENDGDLERAEKKAAAAKKRREAAEARKAEKKARLAAAEAERQRILGTAYRPVEAPDDDLVGAVGADLAIDDGGVQPVGDVEILPPVKRTVPEPAAPERRFLSEESWYKAMARQGEDGGFYADHDNVMLGLERLQEWHRVFTYDEMADCVVVNRNIPSKIKQIEPDESFPRPLLDHDIVATARWFQNKGLRKLGTNITAQCVDSVARLFREHPVRRYLKSLDWDGVPRVGTWLSRYLGAEDDAYVRAIGQMFLVAMIARVARPGCKADYALILEGEQGKTKSTACGILAGEWFSDSLPPIGSKDAVDHLKGMWLIEIAELSAMSKSDVEGVKAFISRRTDKYRPAYGRNEVIRQRQCLFIGTTNKKNYLRDETGGRRFWPVAVGDIDLEGLKRDRDQILAEAKTLFKNGAVWWPDRDFEAQVIRPQQEARFEADAWESSILAFLRDALAGREDAERQMAEVPPEDHTPALRAAAKGWVSLIDVAVGALGLPVGKVGTSETRRITPILEGAGWVRVRTNHGRYWAWGGGGQK